MSDNVSKEDFKKVTRFAKQFVNAFDVSDDGTHVSLVTYGTTPTVHTRLDTLQGSNNSAYEVGKILSRINYQGGKTAAASLALNVVLNDVYAEGNGKRSGVNQVG